MKLKRWSPVEMLKEGKTFGADAVISEILKKEGSTLIMNLKRLIKKYREKK